MNDTSYYKETLPDLISKLKAMVENNLEIVGKNLNPKLNEGNLKTALESRKTAVEDIIWASLEIDRMEFNLNGVEDEENAKAISYYLKIIPRLIKELKGMVDNNLKIIEKHIKEDVPDNKIKAALNSRRLAAENAVWASQIVDALEQDLTGKKKTEETEQTTINWTKRKAKKI